MHNRLVSERYHQAAIANCAFARLVAILCAARLYVRLLAVRLPKAGQAPAPGACNARRGRCKHCDGEADHHSNTITASNKDQGCVMNPSAAKAAAKKASSRDMQKVARASVYVECTSAAAQDLSITLPLMSQRT